MSGRLRSGILIAFSLTGLRPAPAHAQAPPKPLPVVAVDLRVMYPKLGQDPTTARDLSTPDVPIEPADLPLRGFGGAVGVMLYPVRGQRLALGIGGEGLLLLAHRQERDEDGLAVGPSIHRRIDSTALMVSLNFGNRNGWSYVSAGMGPMAFVSYVGDDAPGERRPTKSTINFGGGARWFNVAHLAFCFDMRFYLSRPEELSPSYPGRERQHLLFMSAGVAFK